MNCLVYSLCAIFQMAKNEFRNSPVYMCDVKSLNDGNRFLSHPQNFLNFIFAYSLGRNQMMRTK